MFTQYNLDSWEEIRNAENKFMVEMSGALPTLNCTLLNRHLTWEEEDVSTPVLLPLISLVAGQSAELAWKVKHPRENHGWSAACH